jgi:hypothetical protein
MVKKRTTHGYFLESSRMLIQNAKNDEQISVLFDFTTFIKRGGKDGSTPSLKKYKDL